MFDREETFIFMVQLSATDGVNCEVPMIVPIDVNDDVIQVCIASNDRYDGV